MPFRKLSLLQGLAAAAVSDVWVLWQMPRVFHWHSQTVGALLDMAKVPWEVGREIAVVPGINVTLIRTSLLDYQQHPAFPWTILGASIALYIIGSKFWATPLKPLLLLLPGSLALSMLYMLLVSPVIPYAPEDFCSIWYQGEAYVWLIVPWVFAISFFTLSVPFLMKILWLPLIVVYAFIWSAVRLALALATFYYFGPIWILFFYFVLGFLADFLYIVAFYSLAMDRAARWLASKREVFQ
jgi:hypothetical protein